LTEDDGEKDEPVKARRVAFEEIVVLVAIKELMPFTGLNGEERG
jgi:hypothetical protein